MKVRGRAAGRLGGQAAWPFVGRAEELAWVAARQRAGGCCGVVVSGAPGVGKTRLARELLAAGVAEGGTSEWVQGTRAAASIPLGAFAGLVPPQAGTADRLHLFQLCAETLRRRAAERRVLLGVDDAHLLDAASAALLLHLAASGTAFVVVTVRAGEPCPDPVIALWKDAEAVRLELQQLSADDTASLLQAALGGQVEPGVLRWAFDASEGNVLYLRELVGGALAAGALESAGGRWRLGFRPRPGPALVDLISARLAGLTDEELDAVRLLALGEPLTVAVLAQIAGIDALARLEDRGLAVITPGRDAAGGGQVRLGHPLYGEVVREMTASLRAARLRRQLAEAVQAGDLDQPGDALKVVAWLDEAGEAAGPPLLLAAAAEANAASDPDLAERLAARAGPAGGTEAVLVLARAHALRRRFAEAENLLAGLEGELATPELAASYVAQRAFLVLHLGLERTGDALSLLARARDWFAGADWAERVEAIELEVRTAGPAPGGVIEAAGRVLGRDDLNPQVRRLASASYASALYRAGRTAQAHAVAVRVRPDVPLRDDDVFPFVLWPLVCLECGYDWDQAEAWLHEAGRATAPADDPLTHGQVAGFLGGFALWRGRPVTAARRFREAIASLMRRDPQRRLPLAWLYLVIAEAMRDELDAARAALAAYQDLVADAQVPYLPPREPRALAALAVAEGKTSQAAAMLLEAANRQQAPTERGHLLYQALRADADPKIVAPALAAAAAACDAPLTGVFAAQASALADGDGAGLADTAEALGQIGAWLWAAEAAAQAAIAHTRAGRADSARRALALSGRFQEQCEAPRSPVLAAVQLAPADLTRREREIVELAGRGASNAEIAGRLVLSIRTVESHLYRAMGKLGVGSRGELRALQATGPRDLQ